MWKGLLIEKLLQALSPLLDEIFIKYSIISPKWKLPKQSFSWKRWDDHLRFEQKGEKKKKKKRYIF